MKTYEGNALALKNAKTRFSYYEKIGENVHLSLSKPLDKNETLGLWCKQIMLTAEPLK